MEVVQPLSAFLSAWYDKQLLLWDAATGRQLARLGGHRAPVLHLCTQGAAAASGDRGGDVLCWDPAAARASATLAGAHDGHVTALAWAAGSGSSGGDGGGLLLSGGQDGCLRVWDLRSGRGSRPHQPAGQAVAHAGECGAARGAVGGIVEAAGLVVMAGADGSVKAFDHRRLGEPVWTVQLTDFPYILAATPIGGGQLVLTGCSDSSLHVIDAGSGAVRYALGASRGAVRTIHASAVQLVAGGDDGVAMLYDFPHPSCCLGLARLLLCDKQYLLPAAGLFFILDFMRLFPPCLAGEPHRSSHRSASRSQLPISSTPQGAPGSSSQPSGPAGRCPGFESYPTQPCPGGASSWLC